MQSYFGSISGEENITFLDTRVVDQGISRSLDASAALPRISITDSTTPLSTLPRQNPIQNVQLFGDEDVFICGKCKQPFYELHMFLHHKKEGCIVNTAIGGLISDQQQTCLSAIQLPGPAEFQNSCSASDGHPQTVLLPTLSANTAGPRSVDAGTCHVEVAGLNLTQSSDRNNPVRVAAQSSGICGNPTTSSPPSNLSVNMGDVSSLVQQNSCGLMQSGVVPLGTSRVESIVIPDDIVANSSSQASTVFNSASQIEQCFQENVVNVLGATGMAPLLQTLPAHTSYHQAIPSLTGTQQVYIHIQPQQQLETQTTYSILPKNPSMNYAVGLSLSSLPVGALPINNDSSSSLCASADGYFQPHTISVQDSNVQNIDEYSGQTMSERQTSESLQSPILAVRKKAVTRKVFTCQYCKKTFGKTFDLKQHVRSHTGERPFQCIACGRAFAQKSNVRKHMETHKVWPSEALEVMPIMVTHPKYQSGTDQNENGDGSDSPICAKFPLDVKQCPYCNITLGPYNERKTHMLRHKDKQVYKCVKEDCGQTFAALDDFLRHVKTHIGNMKYRCHHCEGMFDSLRGIRTHQEELEDDANPRQGVKYRCEVCPARFSRPELLQKHMAVETHKHVCTICSKLFVCTTYLEHHMKKVHADASRKKYKCEYCGKLMKSRYYLQSHMLIHTKEKPFQCPTCNAKFNRKDKLARHKVTHDPIKKYKCPFRETMNCMKEFNRPDKLKAHIISHNGIKAHQCSYCSKRFSRRNTKLAHEKSHTIKYSCGKCRKSFKNQSALGTHKCCSVKSQQSASSVGDDRTPSTGLHDDLLMSSGGPMYAYRTGSKRRLLRRNASKNRKAVELTKSTVEINITCSNVAPDDTEVDVEGDS